jgi:hypothetical protein
LLLDSTSAMKAAKAITNDYQDFTLLNLAQLVHRAEGRGPYLVTQDGSAPGDPTLRQCSFVLTKRGTWLHFYLYLALPGAVRTACAQFETLQEAMQQADSMPPQVVVEDAVSLQELLLHYGFEPAADDLTSQALLKEMQRRHAGPPALS